MLPISLDQTHQILNMPSAGFGLMLQYPKEMDKLDIVCKNSQE